MSLQAIESLLSGTSLSIGYENHVLAKQLEIQLKAGEFVCLLGPNGAGKSTLMRTMAGMQPPLGGRITLQGQSYQDIAPRERAKQVSVVLTEAMPIGMMNARSLVALGRHPYSGWLGGLTQDDRSRIEWALRAVGAEALANRQISELSDGERQKVSIARALAQEAKVMLLDEPTAYLDLPRRVELMIILRDLAHQEAMALLLSTHDLELALNYADQIWLLGENGILHQGTAGELIEAGCFPQAFGDSKVDWDQLLRNYRAHSGHVPE
ncbi:MAG: ABC transporter ATP-binding protein [Coraliomargarita sp.]